MADEIAKLDHHYQHISIALGLEDESEYNNQDISREIVKGWLSNPWKQLDISDSSLRLGQKRSNATWLLIFDNADDPMILPDYWPQGSRSILITSRDLLANVFTRKQSGIDLKPLSTLESLGLLRHLTTQINETELETARLISDALGGIPLAISQMAAIIRRQDLTLTEFWELYADLDEHSDLYETKFDTNLVTYRNSIATVWAFNKLKPQSRQLLESNSFFDPDSTGENLLIDSSSQPLSQYAPFKKVSYLEAV